MSRQKEKKIKKLKKRQIWPAVVSMMLFITVFIFIILVLLGLFIENILSNKLGRAMENTRKVAEIISTEQVEEEETLKSAVKAVQRWLPDVKEVCIVGADRQVLAKSGNSQPDLKNELMFAGIENVMVYLPHESDRILYAKEGEVRFDYERVWKNYVEIRAVESPADRVLLEVSIWNAVPLGKDGAEVFVKNEIVVKEKEMISFLAFVLVAFLLIIVFSVYFIIFILKQVKRQRQITMLFYFDEETGGKNWSYLKDKGERMLKKWQHNKDKYALIHVRMNKYQNFCTCYGVQEGMELLEQIDNALQGMLEKRELSVHYARADYAMLLRYESREALEQRVEGIRQQLGSVSPEQRLEFSMGVYENASARTGFEAMYNNASIARTSLPPDGEKKIGWYSEEIQSQQLWERKVEDTMEEAMQRGEFQVYLQPKYSPKEEKLSGAEALVRWISPEEGFIPPNRFIPIFEKNGFILKLDDYMISEVARQQAQWIAEGKQVVPVSVNVSRAHFTQSDLAEHICRLVDQYQVPHQVIELELTESAFFEDKEVLLETVRKFREYGFTVSMDDFGAGYSSLNSLKELPLDVIKLDAEFFRGKAGTEKGEIIVNEVISLAKKLDMRTVAEGIETKEQVDFLAEHGCDLIQGYYFAKPMPISEFEQKAFGVEQGNAQE